jgi:HD-GYP domain-containing protein (c-di-GMP phosphodiesterase class II)
MVNDRPYRGRRSVEEAVAVLVDGAGSQWDPEVVDVFMAEIPTILRLGVA